MGGVPYADADDALAEFATTLGIPVAETQAGKGTLPDDDPLNLGAIGVTGTEAANRAAARADVILAVGTRLQDFTTGSRTLLSGRIIGLNTQPFDAAKHDAVPLVADAAAGLAALHAALAGHRAPEAWTVDAETWRAAWRDTAAEALAPGEEFPPTDARVIGAVRRAAPDTAVLVCAAGGLPGELHKLWPVGAPGGYHLEYGFSCMGYEIAGGLGVKLAHPEREVIVMVGDGSYLMMNSEIATSIAMGLKLTIIVLDNGGFGCIDRLQRATGGAAFNNLVPHGVDLRAHAAAMGAIAEQVVGLAALEDAVARARDADTTSVIVIETDPTASTTAGGYWWDVAVPETSDREEVRAARATYDAARPR